MHAGGSGDVLLAALITRPQSESQIGAGKNNYTSDQGLGPKIAGFYGFLLIHCGYMDMRSLLKCERELVMWINYL